jgi:phosphoribosylaminoimidazolecarboxamide formyltransferase/IMP cyclohydrolase
VPPPPWKTGSNGGLALRSVAGGVLVQSADKEIVAAAKAQLVTKRHPTEAELHALDFAWRVAKHVKSNAIVFAKDGVTIGVGAGQMSRIDSTRLALGKALSPVAGTVLASDAFFPFADGPRIALAAGATSIVQPGGSKRDDDVIEAVQQAGATMIFTGRRHFRH